MAEVSPELLIESPIITDAELAGVIEQVSSVIRPGKLVLVETVQSYNFRDRVDGNAFMSNGYVSDDGRLGVLQGLTGAYVAQDVSPLMVNPIKTEEKIRIPRSKSSYSEWSHDCGLSSGSGTDFSSSWLKRVVVGTDYIEAEHPGITEALEFANGSILTSEIEHHLDPRPKAYDDQLKVLDGTGNEISHELLRGITIAKLIMGAIGSPRRRGQVAIQKPITKESPHTDIDIKEGDLLVGTLRMSNQWPLFRPTKEYIDESMRDLLGKGQPLK